jgi:hypothetical protein
MATGGIVVSDHPHPRWLDVVFALFLASGVTVGAYCLWAVADWIHSQGEGAFGMFYLGVFSFVPALLAWLAGGDSRGSLGAAAHAPSGRRALRPHGRNNGSASQHAALPPTARSFRPTTPGSSDDPSRAHAADARTALPHG